jgi:hypothetical protein
VLTGEADQNNVPFLVLYIDDCGFARKHILSEKAAA